MKNHHEILGNTIKSYRLKAGLTQMDLAEKLGYNTPQFVSLFERGLSKIPLETLGTILVFLKIPEKMVVSILVAGYGQEVRQKISVGKKSAR
jgi:transcriptional regulator with XRE-family HTH domain